jgi:esterase/lipase superfamily enzyme
MHREKHSWISPHLGRRMDFLWFGHWGPAVLIFPTSMGKYYENEDQGLVGALRDKIDNGQLQVVCVDSVDAESWYCRWAHPLGRAWRHHQYDQYLRWELIPYMLHRTHDSQISVFGASFGAYHAANIAARYPNLVRKAICFSGKYDIYAFLNGHWNETCYYHCPTAYIPNMPPDWSRQVDHVQWVIATGEYDHLAEESRSFSRMLHHKWIDNHLEIWPGQFGHDWPWWRQHLRRFLP